MGRVAKSLWEQRDQPAAATAGGRGSASRLGAEDARGVGVGGEERLDGELGDGDVQRRAKSGYRTEEGELSVAVAEAERDGPSPGPGSSTAGSGGSQG